MAHFYFHLDRTFRDGVTRKNLNEVIRPLIKQGKSIKAFLNDKESSIYLSVTLKGKYYKFRTDSKIKPIYWDQERQNIKQTFHSSFEMNTALTLLKQRVEKDYVSALNNNPNITVSEMVEVIKASVKGCVPKNDPKPFFQAYAEYTEEKKKTLKDLTLKKLNNFKNLIDEFEEKYYPVTFQKINSTFEVDFNYFLSHDKKHLNNTIAKHIALLKTFMNWCVEKEIIDTIKFRNFKVKQDECEVLYLTEEELMRLFNLNIDKPYLERVRDRFCLACFTGQRHSDISNFKYTDIQFINGGYEWWLHQIKGNKSKRVTIPLSNNALSIIRKYPRTKDRETILPKLASSNANKYLKELCELANITEQVPLVKYSAQKRIEKVFQKWELITMHTARKTFVTLSLEKGLSPEFIMELTGHEDYKTMRKYLAISQVAVKNEFNRIWNNNKPNDGDNLPLILKAI